jgi:hypothetical protein
MPERLIEKRLRWIGHLRHVADWYCHTYLQQVGQQEPLAELLTAIMPDSERLKRGCDEP